jgi:hypothetical protein
MRSGRDPLLPISLLLAKSHNKVSFRSSVVNLLEITREMLAQQFCYESFVYCEFQLRRVWIE